VRKPSRQSLGLPRRVGKPRRTYAITDEDRDTIIETLTAGGSRALASARVDIAESTLHLEIKRNREFRKRVRKAEAEGEFILIRRATGGDPGWQGSAWMLERKFGYYRPPIQFVDAGAEQKPIRCRRVIRNAKAIPELAELPNPLPLPVALPDANARTG
jgi:hypothetical protein